MYSGGRIAHNLLCSTVSSDPVVRHSKWRHRAPDPPGSRTDPTGPLPPTFSTLTRLLKTRRAWDFDHRKALQRVKSGTDRAVTLTASWLHFRGYRKCTVLPPRRDWAEFPILRWDFQNKGRFYMCVCVCFNAIKDIFKNLTNYRRYVLFYDVLSESSCILK